MESVQIKGSTKTKDLEIISSVKWLIKLEMFYRERTKPWWWHGEERRCVYTHMAHVRSWSNLINEF